MVYRGNQQRPKGLTAYIINTAKACIHKSDFVTLWCQHIIVSIVILYMKVRQKCLNFFFAYQPQNHYLCSMKLLLKRIALRPAYTIGKLYVDGKYICDTIEDCVRDVNKNGRFDNGEKKIYGETAIPYGKYEVTLKVKSPKYSQRPAYSWCGGYLPRLLNVPDFDGILIHAGNTAKDSAGCIIVGENMVVGKVLNSMYTLQNKLYPMLKRASSNGEKIIISIE